ncbi:MAG: hypothetical protein C1O27_001282 [Chloroflexi bacterium]|jgi:hypothetical protein|nr:MAG: hypothetical protein C1O27_001282 [Chloroflexota bacterium]
MQLAEVVSDIADSLVAVDNGGVPFRSFHPGVGPYGEPQLVKQVAMLLDSMPAYSGRISTQRTPDLLIRDYWAIEVKITRPFGDNGKEAENWSVNLLHPYRGNVSSVGDSYKLGELGCSERLAVVVVGYEHSPPLIDLTPLVDSFEAIARYVVGIRLSDRTESYRGVLAHPVHQALRVFGWEVISVG